MNQFCGNKMKRKPKQKCSFNRQYNWLEFLKTLRKQTFWLMKIARQQTNLVFIKTLLCAKK